MDEVSLLGQDPATGPRYDDLSAQFFNTCASTPRHRREPAGNRLAAAVKPPSVRDAALDFPNGPWCLPTATR